MLQLPPIHYCCRSFCVGLLRVSVAAKRGILVQRSMTANVSDRLRGVANDPEKRGIVDRLRPIGPVVA